MALLWRLGNTEKIVMERGEKWKVKDTAVTSHEAHKLVSFFWLSFLLYGLFWKEEKAASLTIFSWTIPGSAENKREKQDTLRVPPFPIIVDESSINETQPWHF